MLVEGQIPPDNADFLNHPVYTENTHKQPILILQTKLITIHFRRGLLLQ